MSKKNDHPSSSKKTKLSFLLNHDDEDEITPNSSGSSSRHSFSGSREDYSRQPFLQGSTGRQMLSSASSFHTGLSSGAGPSSSRHTGILPPVRSSMDASYLNQDAPSSSTDKKGVRKKRQRKFVCDYCKFGFYTNSDLQKHVSSVHLQLRPYECSMCDKKFGERSNATKHFKSVHEKQRNAACNQCDKVFAFRDGLVRHVRLVHENVRNFHCRFPGCGQSFKQSAHLKKHEQIHDKNRVMQRVRAPRRPPSKPDASG